MGRASRVAGRTIALVGRGDVAGYRSDIRCEAIDVLAHSDSSDVLRLDEARRQSSAQLRDLAEDLVDSLGLDGSRILNVEADVADVGPDIDYLTGVALDLRGDTEQRASVGFGFCGSITQCSRILAYPACIRANRPGCEACGVGRGPVSVEVLSRISLTMLGTR